MQAAAIFFRLRRDGAVVFGFGADPDGLSLEKLKANPHGIDLGALKPRIPEVLRTPTGMVELAPEAMINDVQRLHASLERHDDQLVLISRRHLRTNNSWMHPCAINMKETTVVRISKLGKSVRSKLGFGL